MLTRNLEVAYRPGSAGAGAAVTTGSFTPPAHSLLLARLTMQTDSGSGDRSPFYTIADSVGLTWHPIVGVANISPWNVSTQLWYAEIGASPVAMTVTGNDPTSPWNQFVIALDVISYTGYNTSSPIGTSEGFADPPGGGYGPTYGPWSVSLGTAPAVTSEVVAFLGGDTDAPQGAVPGAAFTLVFDNAGYYGMFDIEARPPGSTSTTVDWVDTFVGSTDTGQRCQAVVEIKAASTAVARDAMLVGFIPGV